jgi:hypothetical protein
VFALSSLFVVIQDFVSLHFYISSGAVEVWFVANDGRVSCRIQNAHKCTCSH